MSLYLRDYKTLYNYFISLIETDERVFAESLVYLDDSKTLTKEQKEGIAIAVRKFVKTLRNDLTEMECYEKSLSRDNEEYKAKFQNKGDQNETKED